jgi:hypothetical protein
MGRIVELAEHELSGPANAFFAIGDNQNLRSETVTRPLTAQDLRNELHFYLLFCDRLTLVAEDLLMNEYLTSLLLLPEYQRLFSEGIFVPLLRAQYDSLTDVVHYLRKPDLYYSTSSDLWVPLLDQLKRQKLYVGRFNEDQSYSNFTNIARHYMLNSDFMARYKADQIVRSLENRMDALCKDANRKEWRRSLLFYYAKELDRPGQKRLARTVRHISSVLYTAQFCGQFRQLPAFPSWYGRYLANTTGISPRLGDGVSFTELKTVTLEYLSPGVKPEAGQISVNDILEIRESEAFKIYRRELERCDADEGVDREGEIAFVAALETYVRFLDQRFGEIFGLRYPRKKRLQRRLKFIRGASPIGVVISLTSYISGLAGIPVSLVVSPVWALLTISFLLYRRKAEKEVSEIDIATAKFWSDHCTPGKTCAATLTQSLPKVDKKIKSPRLLLEESSGQSHHKEVAKR